MDCNPKDLEVTAMSPAELALKPFGFVPANGGAGEVVFRQVRQDGCTFDLYTRTGWAPDQLDEAVYTVEVIAGKRTSTETSYSSLAAFLASHA